MPESKSKPKVKAATKGRTKANGPVTGGNASKARSGQGTEYSADWRAETLARMRALILEADPEMVEERKWKKPSNGMVGVPVWSRGGIVCTGETYMKVVKLTFAQGAKVPDPAGLFNSSLEGSTRRAIDIREGEVVNAAAFKALIKAAVALNGSKAKKIKADTKGAASAKVKGDEKAVVLLSGGNPQIAKGDGDAPVQAYIAAMPGWKRDVGRRLDALIARSVPKVRKAVKWNSPFYGIEGQGWFLSFHCFAKYIKVAFFRGAALRPVPPVGSNQKEVRYLHIHEDGELDEAQFMEWVKQASKLPGEWM